MKKRKKTPKKSKGLSPEELIRKYEAGSINLGEKLKKASKGKLVLAGASK